MEALTIEKLPSKNVIVPAGDAFPEIRFTPSEIEKAVQAGAWHLFNSTSVKSTVATCKVLCLFFLKVESFNNLL